MSDRLWLDRETWSLLDLKVVGTYNYAASAEDLLIAYAIGKGEVRVWDCTAEEMHDELFHAMDDPDSEVWAHNAQFDKAVHNGIHQIHLPRIPLERWRCSMAQALSHALPAGLASLCDVLNVPNGMGKLAEGKALVKLFTSPRPANHKLRRATRETHPEEWARFVAYAANDIVAMRECVRRMPAWNWDASAIAEWHADQRINERGFQVDQELTRAGALAATTEKARIATRFAQLSGGAFTPGQRAKFLAYLNTQLPTPIDNTQSGTFQVLLRDPEMPPNVREMMELSVASNRTSTAKYAALDPAVNDDGRFRGGLQFAGAGRTRRWAGRLFQPQNLPSRGLPDAESIEQYIACLKEGVHDLFFDNLMLYGAAALRGTVIVPPGKKMVVADLSNIEGRVLSWLARENWKLDAFRAYDAGTGPDLYSITASTIIGGDPWTIKGKNRNAFGKVPDLACLGADTQVVTQRGLVRIVDVTLEDKLWDGQAWVNHEGLTDNGVRPVVNVDGIEATPDHLINIQGRWTQAQELVSSGSVLCQALETGSETWQSLGLTWDPQGGCGACRCNVLAEPNHTRLPSGTSALVEQPAATCVQRKQPCGPQNDIGAMQTYARMKPTDDGCSTASLHASTDAATPKTGRTQTTEGAEYRCMHLGCKTVKDSCGTCSPCPVGTSQCLNSTEKMLTGTMHPATCDSSPASRIETTNEQSKSCRPASLISKRVYDLVNAGPRHRFLVRSNSGWLLVHNSGYQGGVAGYQTFARSYGIKMSDYWETIQEMISPAFVTKAWENLGKWGRPQLESLEIDEIEWVASETCKLAWRARHPATNRFWYDLGGAAKNAIQNPGGVFAVGPYIKMRTVEHLGQKWLVARLPSGRFLTYFEPHLLSDGSLAYWGEAAEEGKTTRQWQRVFTHGGKLTGNCCQTIARDILAPAITTAEDQGYTPILTVHDEVLTEAPDEDRYSAAGLVDILAAGYSWTKGLPLAAAGFETLRYKKD